MKSTTAKENAMMMSQEIEVWCTEMFKAYSQKDIEDSVQVRNAIKQLKTLAKQLEGRIK